MSGSTKSINSSQQGFGETPAVSRFIPEALRNAADRLVDSLKINSVSEQVRRGRPLVKKRRTLYSEPLAQLTNVYFRIAGIPIRFWAKTEDWQRWEVNSFNMLNGDLFHARAAGANAMCADKLPGRSLSEHLKQGTLTPHMMKAAGRELRRAPSAMVR